MSLRSLLTSIANSNNQTERFNRALDSKASSLDEKGKSTHKQDREDDALSALGSESTNSFIQSMWHLAKIFLTPVLDSALSSVKTITRDPFVGPHLADFGRIVNPFFQTSTTAMIERRVSAQYLKTPWGFLKHPQKH